MHIVLATDRDRVRGAAGDNLRWLAATHVHVHSLAQWPRLRQGDMVFTWVVDALLGTGVKGSPRAPMDEFIRELNQLPARRLAVDIPSGLNADTGEAVESTFRADLTGTFVAAKPGLVQTVAAPFVGQLEIVDIGVPRGILQRFGLHASPR